MAVHIRTPFDIDHDTHVEPEVNNLGQRTVTLPDDGVAFRRRPGSHRPTWLNESALLRLEAGLPVRIYFGPDTVPSVPPKGTNIPFRSAITTLVGRIESVRDGDREWVVRKATKPAFHRNRAK